ncbi:MAG: hypothetical protein HYZ90_03950 [Candidatus Omnitrophica bacterium]|nr:hypothetical protein [Candidatus Omnitrophota bacterium]
MSEKSKRILAVGVGVGLFFLAVLAMMRPAHRVPSSETPALSQQGTHPSTLPRPAELAVLQPSAPHPETPKPVDLKVTSSSAPETVHKPGSLKAPPEEIKRIEQEGAVVY